MDLVKQLFDIILSNFDFGYLFVVTLLTYFLIKLLDVLNKEKNVTTWNKRIALILVIIFISALYIIVGYTQYIKLINSSILAPVFWSWILKPICTKLNIGYKDIDEYLG